MTAFSLFPSFVQMFYHSPWSPHVATIPTRQWSPGGLFGTFKAWDNSDIDADTMIQEYVEALTGLYTTEIVFDYYTVMNYASEEGFPAPVIFNDLGQTGSVTPGTISNKAVQFTITWQCLDNHILKTVLLDANPTEDFNIIGPTTITAFAGDLVTAITAPTNAWASRAGTQPLFPKQGAYTLNEKLRRSYHQN